MNLVGINGFNPYGSKLYVFCENTTKECVVNKEHLLSLGIKDRIDGNPLLEMPMLRPLDTILSAGYDAVEMLYPNPIDENQSVLGVRKGEKCGLINMLGVLLLPIEYSYITCPINCSKPVFCINSPKELKWAAVSIFGEVVVPWGKYKYMWGFDHDHCLVSTVSGTFKNRAVIGINGEIIIPPDKYIDIYNFRGKEYFQVEDANHKISILSTATLELYSNSTADESHACRSNRIVENITNSLDEPKWRDNERNGEYAGTYAQDVMGYSDGYINDAFDGEPDAYWNID